MQYVIVGIFAALLLTISELAHAQFAQTLEWVGEPKSVTSEITYVPDDDGSNTNLFKRVANDRAGRIMTNYYYSIDGRTGILRVRILRGTAASFVNIRCGELVFSDDGGPIVTAMHSWQAGTGSAQRVEQTQLPVEKWASAKKITLNYGTCKRRIHPKNNIVIIKH
jgi:hypothetical protein